MTGRHSSREKQVRINNDPEQLAKLVAEVKGLIVLDGCAGAGKTYLTRLVANHIECEWVEVDRFLERGRDQFLDSLRINDLRKRVDEALALSRIVILEGVCARDILERIRHTASLLVYVQRTSSATGLPSDVILDQEEEDAEPYEPADGLDNEVAEYHRRCRPRATSDVLYIRYEETGGEGLSE